MPAGREKDRRPLPAFFWHEAKDNAQQTSSDLDIYWWMTKKGVAKGCTTDLVVLIRLNGGIVGVVCVLCT